ncbi:MAG: YHS domain-containing (seleno)protein [Alphaproteobacteria bacterium]
MNTNDSAFAIGGYDPVAYFTTGAPARGLEAFAHTWNGATWLFVSAAHRDLFAGDPEAYAPQYGGWCSWAVAHGYTARIDPDAWDIVDGKLYLNFSTFTQIRWRLAPSRYIADGDANWLRLSQ